MRSSRPPIPSHRYRNCAILIFCYAGFMAAALFCSVLYGTASIASIWMVIPIAVCVLAGVSLMRDFQRRDREETGKCVDCGYSLTGNTSGVCPECGCEIN